ncbi:hypothetical protein, partial [Helicobacter sp. 11S02596-1]|uniref:hypothetical protein n=1 Tax=Helicobacter sp. 11S02596-1 TaxID=1476194 RepID=UPI00117AE416
MKQKRLTQIFFNRFKKTISRSRFALVASIFGTAVGQGLFADSMPPPPLVAPENKNIDKSSSSATYNGINEYTKKAGASSQTFFKAIDGNTWIALKDSQNFNDFRLYTYYPAGASQSSFSFPIAPIGPLPIPGNNGRGVGAIGYKSASILLEDGMNFQTLILGPATYGNLTFNKRLNNVDSSLDNLSLGLYHRDDAPMEAHLKHPYASRSVLSIAPGQYTGTDKSSDNPGGFKKEDKKNLNMGGTLRLSNGSTLSVGKQINTYTNNFFDSGTYIEDDYKNDDGPTGFPGDFDVLDVINFKARQESQYVYPKAKFYSGDANDKGEVFDSLKYQEAVGNNDDMATISQNTQVSFYAKEFNNTGQLYASGGFGSVHIDTRHAGTEAKTLGAIKVHNLITGIVSNGDDNLTADGRKTLEAQQKALEAKVAAKKDEKEKESTKVKANEASSPADKKEETTAQNKPSEENNNNAVVASSDNKVQGDETSIPNIPDGGKATESSNTQANEEIALIKPETKATHDAKNMVLALNDKMGEDPDDYSAPDKHFTSYNNYSEGRMSAFDYGTIDIIGTLENKTSGTILLVDGGRLNVTGDFKNEGWIMTGAIDTNDAGYINVTGKSTLSYEKSHIGFISKKQPILADRAYLLLKSKGGIEITDKPADNAQTTEAINPENFALFTANKINGRLSDVEEFDDYARENLKFSSSLGDDNKNLYVSITTSQVGKQKSIAQLYSEAVFQQLMNQLRANVAKNLIPKKIRHLEFSDRIALANDLITQYEATATKPYDETEKNKISAEIASIDAQIKAKQEAYDTIKKEIDNIKLQKNTYVTSELNSVKTYLENHQLWGLNEANDFKAELEKRLKGYEEQISKTTDEVNKKHLEDRKSAITYLKTEFEDFLKEKKDNDAVYNNKDDFLNKIPEKVAEYQKKDQELATQETQKKQDVAYTEYEKLVGDKNNKDRDLTNEKKAEEAYNASLAERQKRLEKMKEAKRVFETNGAEGYDVYKMFIGNPEGKDGYTGYNSTLNGYITGLVEAINSLYTKIDKSDAENKPILDKKHFSYLTDSQFEKLQQEYNKIYDTAHNKALALQNEMRQKLETLSKEKQDKEKADLKKRYDDLNTAFSQAQQSLNEYVAKKKIELQSQVAETSEYKTKISAQKQKLQTEAVEAMLNLQKKELDDLKSSLATKESRLETLKKDEEKNKSSITLYTNLVNNAKTGIQEAENRIKTQDKTYIEKHFKDGDISSVDDSFYNSLYENYESKLKEFEKTAEVEMVNELLNKDTEKKAFDEKVATAQAELNKEKEAIGVQGSEAVNTALTRKVGRKNAQETKKILDSYVGQFEALYKELNNLDTTVLAIAVQNAEKFSDKELKVMEGIEKLSPALKNTIAVQMQTLDPSIVQDVIAKVDKHNQDSAQATKSNTTSESMGVIFKSSTTNRLSMLSNPFGGSNNSFEAMIKKAMQYKYADNGEG